MIMRDTVFCMIGPDADHDAITASVHEMVAEVQEYVPGYTLRAEPQFDDPRADWSGQRAGWRCSSRSRATATTCPTTPATSTS